MKIKADRVASDHPSFGMGTAVERARSIVPFPTGQGSISLNTTVPPITNLSDKCQCRHITPTICKFCGKEL